MFDIQHPVSNIQHPAMRISVFTIAVLISCGMWTDATRGADPRLITRWAASVTPENCWREYPRPQMKRTEWLNLNGLWDIAITPTEDDRPTNFSKQILVPFPIESYLGRLGANVTPSDKASYRRTFKLPASWMRQRVLLHFGAVDWSTTVWINGKLVGSHEGGYDPFHFDITEPITWDGENEIVVAVIDPTDRGFQPRGKQKLKPEGIWYTPVSGIWQTVWLEPVPEASISGLRIVPDARAASVSIEVLGSDAANSLAAAIDVLDAGKTIASANGRVGRPVSISIQDPKLWSPARPFLYDLRIRLLDGQEAVDEVTSYFGLRSIALGQDQNGLTRIMLNGEPVFQYGPLDQGYWPDGLYTPPSDEAMKYDLVMAKRLGFNMVRKHVKVEPARWYYWCDRLGLLVWQDMPNGDQHAPWPEDGVEMNRSPASAAQFRRELKAIVDFCRNSPSVVVWIPFNEGWGQFDTQSVSSWLKSYDPSRLVISASGGNDLGGGDIDDDHFYPGPGSPPAEKDRAAVLGEFGGFGLPLPGHTWLDEASWSYRSFRNAEELTKAYVDALEKLRPLVESHLSAAVYTQITDVEIEVNGLMTYDREVLKPDEDAIRSANDKLFQPLPKLTEARRRAAPTLAWWRFEDGGLNSRLPDIAGRMGAIAARDMSGHNNHLYAFSPQTAPSLGKAGYAAQLKIQPVQNTSCMDDTELPGEGVAARDLFTDPYLSRTHMDLVDRFPFSAWTVEASFSAEKTNREQVVVAKQSQPKNAAHPPFQLGLFGQQGWIEVRVLDGSAELRTVKSRIPVEAGKWYHVAATCDGALLKLYVRPDDEPDYELHDEIDAAGALQRSAGTWIVGRGFQGTETAFDFSGSIDEVRISSTARDKSEFLFAQ
jgi:hypothetical protein